MKKEVVPAYGISASLSSAAAECTTGMETRLMTLLKMTASLSVHVPLWHRGSNRPCSSAAFSFCADLSQGVGDCARWAAIPVLLQLQQR